MRSIDQLIIAKQDVRAVYSEQATPILETLAKKYPKRHDITDELAACYVALERYAEANEALGRIPGGAISAQALAAKQFIEHRLKGTLGQTS